MDGSCRDYISNLADYIDGELAPELCEEIKAHIGECKDCRIMVDTLRQTVTLCREGKPERLPLSLESRLNALLKQRWDRKFGRK